jgi:hypothetical protein
MLAVHTLTNNLAAEKLAQLEAVAYATAGLGFALFFFSQGVSVFIENKKKMAFIIPLTLAPIVFILGQLISLSVVQNMPSMLDNEQKGLALKSTFALKLQKTDGIAPFFFERGSIKAMDDMLLSSQYNAKISEREAKLQLLSGIRFISEMADIYKYGQPTGKELRIFRSKHMIDFLKDSAYRDFDRRGFSLLVNMNPIEPNPAIDILADIDVFMSSEELNYKQKILMSKYHVEKKSQDYAALFMDVSPEDVDLDYHFKQNDAMTRNEFAYLLVNGFGVSQDVANKVSTGSLDNTLNYGMTQKMFDAIIPEGFEFSPLSIGLSEKQFLNHRFVQQLVEINAPIMMFKGVQFIPVNKLSNFEYADTLHSQINAGIDGNVMSKIARLNTAISAEMFNGGYYWDGAWAERVVLKKLIPSVSMPIIIGISMLLVMLNLYSVMTILNLRGTLIAASLSVVALGFFFMDVTHMSECYSQNIMAEMEWLIDAMASVGMKPAH